MIDHVCSSQAFALNLFAGFPSEGLVRMMRELGIPATDVDPPTFEWTDPGWLREATVASPHATQIDMALHSRLEDGRRHLLLVEVKLSEDDFSNCGGFQSSRNDARDTCRSDGPFGRDLTGVSSSGTTTAVSGDAMTSSCAVRSMLSRPGTSVGRDVGSVAAPTR
ncbi:MAG: PGN_0703 family putative restriction endonuclease [Acidimicrobiales bacterium]